MREAYVIQVPEQRSIYILPRLDVLDTQLLCDRDALTASVTDVHAAFLRQHQHQ